jgi:hypothetical protein
MGKTKLYYCPPTTEKEPIQKYILMAELETMQEADKFKYDSIKNDRELRKGSWFFGKVRI